MGNCEGCITICTNIKVKDVIETESSRIKSQFKQNYHIRNDFKECIDYDAEYY